MDERIRRAVGDEPAWVVGGALRDELLGREIVDVDVACPNPELAARLYSRLAGGVVFLSPSGTASGASRSATATRSTSHRCTARPSRRTWRRGTSRSMRSRGRSAEGRSSIPSAGRLTWPHGGFARSASRSSTTTRCACSGPCA